MLNVWTAQRTIHRITTSIPCLIWLFNFSFTDDLFADLGATTKKSKPKKTITLDDDDLFGDPLGGLKWFQMSIGILVSRQPCLPINNALLNMTEPGMLELTQYWIDHRTD